MGFFRIQQERLAARLLAWQYQRMGLPVPSAAELQRQAGQIVEDAHRIARERGRNVVSIIKDLIEDLKNKSL